MSHVLIVGQGSQKLCYPIATGDVNSVLVGRAVHCDVVLTDEFLDPEHLQITLDQEGYIQIEDLATVNGSRLGKNALRSATRYKSGTNILLGETSISLIDAESAKTPAKKYDIVHKASRTFESWAWMIVATAVAFSGLLVQAYTISVEKVSTETLTEASVMLGLVILCWSAIAATIGMLFRQKLFFRLHWMFACLILTTAWVATVVMDLVKFNLDSSAANTLLDLGLIIAFCSIFSYGAMSLMFQWQKSRRLLVAGLLVLGPVVVKAGMPLLSEDRDFWTSSANPSRTSLPPSLLFRSPVSVDEHIAKVDNLFAMLIEEVGQDSIDDLPETKDHPIDAPATYSLMD